MDQEQATQIIAAAEEAGEVIGRKAQETIEALIPGAQKIGQAMHEIREALWEAVTAPPKNNGRGEG